MEYEGKNSPERAEEGLKQFSLLGPPLLIILCTLCAGLGSRIFLAGAQATPESRAFTQSSGFMTWMFLNLALFAFYPILIAIQLGPLLELKDHIQEKRRELGIGLVVAHLFLAVLFYVPTLVLTPLFDIHRIGLSHIQTRLFILSAAGYIFIAFPAITGSWLVYAAIHLSLNNSDDSSPEFACYLRYRSHFNLFLLILGAGLSMLVLTSAAARMTGIQAGVTSLDKYPDILLLIIGAYNTLFVALVYLPAYWVLQRSGKRLLGKYSQLPLPDDSQWVELYNKRKDLEEYLELRLTPQSRLVAGLSLLAPIASSLFSVLVQR